MVCRPFVALCGVCESKFVVARAWLEAALKLGPYASVPIFLRAVKRADGKPRCGRSCNLPYLTVACTRP